MHHKSSNIAHTLILVITGILATAPTFAERQAWGGYDKTEQHERREHQNHDRERDHRSFQPRDADDFRGQRHFDDRRRAVIHDYYIEQFNTERCPPGLAKRGNGCAPLGRVRQWRIGYPLPRNIIYYDLPSAVVMQLGPPRVGYRYVRVGSDILLIAIGTGLVVDAILDIGGY